LRAHAYDSALRLVAGDVADKPIASGRCAAVLYNSLLRRFFYHSAMALIRRVTGWRGMRWEFAEYRFTTGEMRRILERAGFEWEGAWVDDYRVPKAKGIWVDYNPLLGRRGRMWELNTAGRAIQRVLNAISPWLSCAGVLCAVRKRAEGG